MNLPFDIFNLFHFSAASIADLIFFFAAALVAIISVVLFFHWRRYGMGGAVFAVMEMVYLGGAAVLLAVAFFTL